MIEKKQDPNMQSVEEMMKKFEEISKQSHTVIGPKSSMAIEQNADENNDGAALYDALAKKMFTYDNQRKRLLAFTDTMIIEVTPPLEGVMFDATEKYMRHFYKKTERRGLGVDHLAEALTILESINAAYLDGPRFNALKNDLNDFLLKQLNEGDEETVRRVNEALVRFFQKSSDNISRGLIKFDNIRYRVDTKGDKVPDTSYKGLSIRNEEEKEALRLAYITEMFDKGIFDYDFMFRNGIITNLNLDLIDGILSESKRLTHEELENAYIASGAFDSREEILDYYLKTDKKFLINFATTKEVVDYLKQGKLSPKDVTKKLKIQEVSELDFEDLEMVLSIENYPRNAEFITTISGEKGRQERYISKELLKKIDEEKILKLLDSDKLKYKMSFDSKDYIEQFGRYSLDTIKLLHQRGLIDDEDIIKITFAESVKLESEEEYNKSLEYVLDVYNFETLSRLNKDGKLNKKFVETFNNMLRNIPKELRDEYLNKILYFAKQNLGNETNFVNMLKQGFDFENVSKIELCFDNLTELYLEGDIDDKFILNLYEKTYMSKDCIKYMYSDEEILRLYEEGKLDAKVLNLLADRKDVIKRFLEKEKISLRDVLGLYSDEDGININELKDILENQSLENENLAEYIIGTNISEGKIETLFESFLISQDDLDVLVGEGIISKEKAEEYANKMNTHEAFEKLFGKSRFAKLVKDTEGNGPGIGVRGLGTGYGDKRSKAIKNDPELRRLLIAEIGFDDREIYLSGENNSLDGYTVKASEEYGIMVFSNPDKPGNAAYVMSLQQGMFFINRYAREQELAEKQGRRESGMESTATKQELRATEHVKVRNACRGFGKNMVDSMRQLSPVLDKKIKSDKEYKARIDEIIEAIKEDYDERKR